MMGHIEDFCKSKPIKMKDPEYIKLIGPRISDRKFSSYLLKSPNYGSYNLVPKELIRKMGELVLKGCNQANQETSS